MSRGSAIRARGGSACGHVLLWCRTGRARAVAPGRNLLARRPRSGGLCLNDIGLEVAGPLGRGNSRAAPVLGLAQRRVLLCRPYVLLLQGRRLHMLFATICDLLRRCASSEAPLAAVEAHAGRLGRPDRLTEHVGDIGHIGNVVDCAIIKETAAAPVTAFVSGATIAVSVVDPAVEADMLAPIPGMEAVSVVLVPPISRRPKQTEAWRLDPGPWDPEIAVLVVERPIAWRPKPARSRDHRLFVDGQGRRRNTNSQNDLGSRGGNASRNGAGRRQSENDRRPQSLS